MATPATEEKDLGALVKTAVLDAVKPLADQVGLVETNLGEIKSRLDTHEKQAVRYDADGSRFTWPGGETKAPAFVKAAGQDSRPLALTNIWRAVMLGQSNPGVMQSIAGEEFAFSQKLARLGYTTAYLGSILFPLGPELFMDPVDEKGQAIGDWAGLRKEVRERLAINIDPGELAWTFKQHPQLAKGFGLDTKDLQLGNDTLGGQLVPWTQSTTVIDLLRARLALMAAGAREVPLPPSGNIAYPRLTSDPTFAYADPDSTSDASTSNIGTGVVRLQAKSIRGFVTIPNDLMRYSSPSIELIVRGMLASGMAVVEDNQFLEGVGSSIAPKGLITYTQSVAETPATGTLTLHVASTTGGSGDTWEPEDVAKVRALYEMGKDPDPPTAWIMRPLMWSAIKNRRADAASAGDAKGPFMFPTSRGLLGEPVPDLLDGVRVVSTVQASANRVKSVSTLGYILYGNFNRALIGRVGTIEIAASEHIKFLQDKTVLRVVGRNDLGVEQESSLVFTDTLLQS